MPGFSIYVDVGVDAVLSEEDVWPDGDMPDNPTADDVIKAMKKSGSIRNMLDEWNLLPDRVDVSVRQIGDVEENETIATWHG